MLDTILDELKKILKSRLLPIALIFFCLFGVLIYRIFTLQIVKGEEYQENTDKRVEKTNEIKATRGNIYDRNGVLLAYNELSYSIVLEDTGELKTNDEKNAMIYKLVQLLKKNDDEIAYDFPIGLDEDGNLYFKVEGNSELRFKRDIYSAKSVDELTEEMKNATAEEVFDFIRFSTESNSPKFGIGEEYTVEEALDIMTIRYIMFIETWSRQLDNYVPITIANDLSQVTVAALKEYSDILPGVEVVEETRRVYNDSEYFAHILGYTGLISAETLQDMEDEGNTYYSATDQIGKTGLESIYEDYLRGVKGTETITKNENNRVVSTSDRVEPIAGNNIYLTIDANLQKACYQLLEKQIAGILISKIHNGTDSGSKGISADNITIPIYDVYYALIDNNVININKFQDEYATDVEKAVYEKFLSKQKAVMKQMKTYLSFHSTAATSSLSEEYQEYLDYVYTVLKDNELLLSSLVDTDDSVYKDYSNGKISLSEFLQYALANNWIDLEQLDIGDEYYSTEELYTKLIEYTIELLKKDTAFNKKIYHALIYSFKLTGKEICLLLFEQGVIEYKEEEIAALNNGTISAYNFILDKIKNLDITPAQLALKPCSGSIVVTDVETGEVRACVTYPSYDNNKLANTIDSEYFTTLQTNQSYPFMNRATKQTTAPGSTFKILSSILALEEGIIGYNETIYDKVVFDKITPSARCWSSTSHGKVDVSDAIGVSCNYFFYELAYKMSQDSNGNYISDKGLKLIQKYADILGLSAKSGIELSEEEPNISNRDAVRTMIGQGDNLLTPIQLSRYVTTVANRGTCYNLTITDKIKDVSGAVVLDKKAEVLNQVQIHEQTWDEVTLGMYKVVNGPESSISSLFKDLDKVVAGKTGTAQLNKSNPNHALFISFAPYENPEISVTAVIPNGYKSSNAAEVARDVYKYYFSNEKDKKKMLESKVDKPELDSPGFQD
ncbi:penicillin-binding transpeptidase domain-containing protein [Anaeromicropila populeti]|uniref:Beta-lactamase n=1 Tax=Anaeromicropila populeti TaxID=37658 RepID=A0A1I6L819_9FIRM|nr:penicillin-binding transpeptidase domain-containing protein [Anaeromicropila populeti]SFR99567.1 penicillin-binding protein 2 [Anaeromicropila populeti]